MYMLTEEESRLKEILWKSQNKEFLRMERKKKRDAKNLEKSETKRN